VGFDTDWKLAHLLKIPTQLLHRRKTKGVGLTEQFVRQFSVLRHAAK